MKRMRSDDVVTRAARRRIVGIVAAVAIVAGACSGSGRPAGHESPRPTARSAARPTTGTAGCEQAATGCGLRDIASRSGLRIGTAVDATLLDSEFLDYKTGITDRRYATVLAREFNSLTTETQLEWTRVEPARNRYDFGAADRLVAFAQAHHMQVRGHALLWGTSAYGYPGVPTYLRNADPSQMRQLVADHIRTVVGRYRGRINRWDVVNEPLQPFGTRLDDTPFRRKLGDGYIAYAFRIAHEADPRAELWLNEVLFNQGPPFEAKARALLSLVDKLLAEHVPITGVGLQTHLFRGILPDPDPVEYESLIRRLGERGLRVAFTEFDVKVAGNRPDRFTVQADWYRKMIDTCLAVRACQEVTFWGFTDRFDWEDDIFGPGVAQSHIFDRFYQPKPAYFAVRDELLAHEHQ
jgi:endo-1,4-beta-xylanase